MISPVLNSSAAPVTHDASEAVCCGFSDTQSVLAEAELLLGQMVEFDRSNKKEERNRAEREAKAALADHKKAAKIGLAMQISTSVVSAAVSIAGEIKDLSKNVTDAITKTVNFVTSMFGIWTNKLTENAKEHEAEAANANAKAGNAADQVQHAEGYKARALNHLDAIAQAEEKARDAAILR